MTATQISSDGIYLHQDDAAAASDSDGDGGLRSDYVSPGLALIALDDMRETVIVRWDPPSGMPAPLVATVRRLLLAAVQSARRSGSIAMLYHPPAWSYPP